MSDMEEAVWRAALAARGRDWVARELKTRRGLPNDPVLDVVFEAPMPSRTFCQNWVAEQENRLFVFSPAMVVGIILAVVIAASATMAVLAFENASSRPAIIAR